MGTFGRVCFVVVVLVVILIAVAGASEPAEAGVDVGARDAPKSGRVNSMAAWSVDSGGGESIGGDFSLTAAIGQPDASQLSRGGTVMDGGLWAGVVDRQLLFWDGFEDGGTGAWSAVVGGTR